jgi:4-amino-4-deoxy-L-arabinose transferase-like glycosyltransferase
MSAPVSATAIENATRETPLTSQSQALPITKFTTLHRIAWALLIAATLYICYFSNLNVIGFVGPDEPRYAWIARDMAESGDWVTPRLYGRPWFEKPPLLYWGGAVFFKLMPSEPEIAARLPSAISALLATLALAWLAWRAYGEECARWLLLLLPTSVGMIGFSHACATDMPFAGTLTVSLVCAAVVLGLVSSNDETPILPRTPWLAMFLFGFFMGLAVLAKGPAALILMGGAVFCWALFTKRWRDAFRLLHPVAIATFCVTALPWYILCARRNPDFFRIFIIEHNFKRYLTPEFQHIQPFWFYIPIMLIGFLPWIAILAWSVLVEIRKRQSQPLALFLFSWSVFCLVFFSLSKSKLPGYILPAIPAIGFLFVRSVQSHGPSQPKSFRVSAALGSFLFVFLTIFSFGLSKLTAHHSHLNAKAGEAYSLLAGCFALANLFLVFVRWKKPLLSRFAVFLAPIPILAAMFFAPYFVDSSFEYDPSGRTVAETIERAEPSPPDLFVGPINRGKYYGLNFYLHKEIPVWDPSHPQTGVLLLRGPNCSALVSPPYMCSNGRAFLSSSLVNSGVFVYEVTLPGLLGEAGSRRKPD